MLATDSVVETSGANLTGQHVGTTKKIVEEKMQEARGGVLFIDEAYGVTGSQYGQEAIDTLCGMLTLEDYMDGKTIVIMGGYKSDMNLMLEENEGLKSRFSSTVEFDNWTSEKCLGLVEKLCAKGGYELASGGKDALLDGFDVLSAVDEMSGDAIRKGWANARDSVTMYEYVEGCRNSRVAKLMKGGTYDEDDAKVSCAFTEDDCREAVSKFVHSRPKSDDLRGLRKRAPSGAGGALTDFGVASRVEGKARVVVNQRVVAAQKKKRGDGEDEKQERERDRVEDELEGDIEAKVDLSQIKVCVETNYNRMDVKNDVRKAAEVKKASEELTKCKEECKAKRKLLKKQQAEEDEEEMKKTALETKKLEKELMELRKKELLRGIADCENHYSFKRFGNMWVCEGGRHEVSEDELMRCYALAYPFE
jgi:hypothetical protein